MIRHFALGSFRGRASAACLAVASFAVVIALAEPSPARSLRVKKPLPEADTLRSADAPDRTAPSATPRVSRPVRRLPIDIPPAKSVFERGRKLERRPSALRGGGPDTTFLNVGVLRIEFAEDRRGDQTTGDGRMMRTNPDPDGTFIDPPPHDADYFQAHLTALDRYWRSMTYDNVVITGDVLPLGQEFGAYTLSDMADYGPENENEFFSVEGLTRFFKDCLIAADADSAVVWDDYDVLFIVHAGSDWQNDVLGNSPFDLPTFSISLSDSDIVVADTGDTLTTGIVFPETSSQDGFLVALNGAIAHEMGHQLGLFDIYNVETFAPTAGFYDLMDSGNLASVIIPSPTSGEEKEVIGVLPTAVGAWSRWLVLFRFGIDPPLLKQDISRARLRAVQSRVPQASLPENTYKWARLPISDAEYFLLENRVDDLDGRDAEGFFNTALDQDDSTGVVLGPLNAATDSLSHNYDLLLDPGLVVWHVDERQVLANFAQGRGINVFYDKRAVTIEEADGIVDIGSPFSEFPLGTDRETYHAGNNANFSPTTRPNSDSNLRSPSNISVLNVGPRDTTMVMDISFSSKPRGWPMKIAPYGAAGLASVTAANVQGDERAEIVAPGDSTLAVFQYDDADDDGDVDVQGNWPAPPPGSRVRGRIAYPVTVGTFRAGEAAVVAVTDSGGVYVWDGNGDPFANADSTGLLLDLAPATGLAWAGIPADLDGNGVDELYLATQDGFFHGFDLSGAAPTATFTPRPLPNTPPDSAETFSACLAFGDLDGDDLLDGLVTFVDEDSAHVHVFDVSGRRSLRRALPLPPESGARRAFVSLADFDRNPENNNLEILLATDRGYLIALDRQGDPLPGWPVTVAEDVAGPAAFGDVDGDGLLEAVVSSGTRRLDVLNYNGTSVPGWPHLVKLADHPGGQGAAPAPAVVDVDGDGKQDVLCGFVDFTIRAFDGGAREIAGFPLVTGAPMRTTPAVLDANGDRRLDLFALCTDGFVYGRILAGLASETNPAWGMFGAGPKLHGSFDERRLPPRGGDGDSLVRGPVTIFPNPAFSHHESISFRYTLGAELASATEVEISLYNLAGELIERFDGTTFANTENVARIPVDRLASGAYFCTLRARSGERENSILEKFAVIR